MSYFFFLPLSIPSLSLPSHCRHGQTNPSFTNPLSFSSSHQSQILIIILILLLLILTDPLPVDQVLLWLLLISTNPFLFHTHSQRPLAQIKLPLVLPTPLVLSLGDNFEEKEKLLRHIFLP